eukprot:13603034-Alexandrium_andersonii.AAC.1
MRSSAGCWTCRATAGSTRKCQMFGTGQGGEPFGHCAIGKPCGVDRADSDMLDQADFGNVVCLILRVRASAFVYL